MSEDRDYEKEARDDGWVPQEDWKGDPERHVDAKVFVERGEKISGILKSKNKRLEDRIDSLTSTMAEFRKYTDGQKSKDVAENKRLVTELENIKAQAITDGDGPAAVKAEREIKNLEVNEPTMDQEAHNQMSAAWAANNTWYADNPKLRTFANGTVDEVLREGYTGQAYFNELTRRTKEAFPEEFKNPNRDKTNGVEDGGVKEVKDSKAETWANLPAEDKAIANRFIKDMPGFTKEKFLDQYEWE